MNLNYISTFLLIAILGTSPSFVFPSPPNNEEDQTLTFIKLSTNHPILNMKDILERIFSFVDFKQDGLSLFLTSKKTKKKNNIRYENCR